MGGWSGEEEKTGGLVSAIKRLKRKDGSGEDLNLLCVILSIFYIHSCLLFFTEFQNAPLKMHSLRDWYQANENIMGDAANQRFDSNATKVGKQRLKSWKTHLVEFSLLLEELLMKRTIRLNGTSI